MSDPSVDEPPKVNQQLMDIVLQSAEVVQDTILEVQSILSQQMEEKLEQTQEQLEEKLEQKLEEKLEEKLREQREKL